MTKFTRVFLPLSLLISCCQTPTEGRELTGAERDKAIQEEIRKQKCMGEASIQYEYIQCIEKGKK